ncbi:MAG: Xaa-Pro peptidase family protein [Anaerolineales bacterium]|jgi:Xaa-Pro dipeptidase
MNLQRLERLAVHLATAKVDAVALVPGPNLFYLTGLSFHLMERPVVAIFPRSGDPVIILPELEVGKLQEDEVGLRPFPYAEDEASRTAAFKAAARSLKTLQPRLAVEHRRMRLIELDLLEAAFQKVERANGDPLLYNLRACKDEQELEAMREAVRIAEQAIRNAMPRLRPGVTERDFASEILLQSIRAGSDAELPFAPIVAFGPNSALPHAVPTERKLAHDELVLLDWGATCRGYASDVTRTYVAGEIGGRLRMAFEAVRTANEAGRQAIGPGVSAEQVDRAARRAIREAGFGLQFVHRTGHGLGLEAHEEPYIREGNAETLLPGMTFTVEPGVYLHGQGGIRIEDDVCVTEQGVEVLTSLPRGLQQVEA